jgi:hypothetical protein
MNCSILFGMQIVRRLSLFLVLVGPTACTTYAPRDIDSQVAFLNHSFAVIDQATADAIEQSSYLRRFGVFSVRTTHADAGESWTGRYLLGRTTYLEIFGPKDGGGDLGATGIAISPDHIGGLSVLMDRFARNNASPLDTDLRTRQYGEEQVPWFNAAHTDEESDTLSVWAMEYLPSFMNDPRSGKRPARSPDDVISRERSLTDDYLERMMRDISLIEIAATVHDIVLARPMLSAAGFRVSQERNHLIARDAHTTIVLSATSREADGIRRVEFVLNAQTKTHVEHLGRSTLIVGPGAGAVWRFEAASAR